MPNQRLNSNIDDIDHIFFSPRGFGERLPHQRFSIVAKRLDLQKFTHGRQVFAPSLGGVVLPQILSVMEFAQTGGNMSGNGIRHLPGDYEITRALIGF